MSSEMPIKGDTRASNTRKNGKTLKRNVVRGTEEHVRPCSNRTACIRIVEVSEARAGSERANGADLVKDVPLIRLAASRRFISNIMESFLFQIATATTLGQCSPVLGE